jgi:hypothetical protein
LHNFPMWPLYAVPSFPIIFPFSLTIKIQHKFIFLLHFLPHQMCDKIVSSLFVLLMAFTISFGRETEK